MADRGKLVPAKATRSHKHRHAGVYPNQGFLGVVEQKRQEAISTGMQEFIPTKDSWELWW